MKVFTDFLNRNGLTNFQHNLLGVGWEGVAYKVGQGVLKYTSSHTEYTLWEKLQCNSYVHFCKVYDTLHCGGGLYVGYKEYVHPLPNNERHKLSLYVDLVRNRGGNTQVLLEVSDNTAQQLYELYIELRHLGLPNSGDVHVDNLGYSEHGVLLHYDVDDYSSVAVTTAEQNTQCTEVT